MFKMLLATASVCVLAGCSSGAGTSAAKAEISKVADVKSSFGPAYKVTDISDLGWKDGMEFCLALPERAGVVAIPTQPFHDSSAGDQLVRWAFCKEASVIEEALSRLGSADLAAG